MSAGISPWRRALQGVMSPCGVLCGTRLRRPTAGLVAGLWLSCAALACDSKPEATTPSVPDDAVALESAAPAACPSKPVSSARAPGTTDRHQSVSMWSEAAGSDELLLPADALPDLNRRFGDVVGGWRDIDDRAVGDPDQVQAAIEERIRVFGNELDAGRLQEGSEGAFDGARTVVASATRVDHYRVVVEEAPLWCSPIAGGLFRIPADLDFDRNACASLHPGERVRVLRRGPKGRWLYVHAGHTVGWLQAPSLTPRLSRDELDRWRAPHRLVPLRDDVVTDDGWRLRLGTSVPIQESGPDEPPSGSDERENGGWTVLVPSETGLRRAHVSASQNVSDGVPELTRAAALDIVFSEQGDPYGWGGRAGERDCSRLLRDLFATFGVQLGRHSGVQAEQGMRNVDVSGLDPEAKRAAIRKAGEGALVLLYMRGHIMLYLGPDDAPGSADGAPGAARDYAISAISEYVEPCEGGDPTVHRIDRVAVTTLALGAGTPRTSFLERISRLVIFETPQAPPATPQPPA